MRSILQTDNDIDADKHYVTNYNVWIIISVFSCLCITLICVCCLVLYLKKQQRIIRRIQRMRQRRTESMNKLQYKQQMSVDMNNLEKVQSPSEMSMQRHTLHRFKDANYNNNNDENNDSNMELKQGLPHHRDLGISAVVEHSNTKSEGQGLDFSCRTKIFFSIPSS